MILENLEEDTVYEVLISTNNGDFNIKPFGMRFVEGDLIFKLYPNHTLFNIKKNSEFMIHFTSDILLYTKAAFGKLSRHSLKLMDCSIFCEVIKIDAHEIEDDYGKNIITTITANPVKIIENKSSLPTINRATNKIIELLVEISRYGFMDEDAQKDFIKKIETIEKFIQKNGNTKHKKAIKLIKKELKDVNLHD